MSVSFATIRAFEERSMNEWPALQTFLMDGWVLRFANGYTRRANSVNVLYGSVQDQEQKIATCETLYARRSLKTTFKITSAPSVKAVDTLLAERGYQFDAPTSVQAMSLEDFKKTMTPSQVALSLDTWLTHYYRINEVKPANRPILQHMLQSIVFPTCFMALYSLDQVVACGIGVLQEGHIGLLNIVTDPTLRNQGFGRSLMQGLLAWGREQGAHTAALSVMLDNLSALHLYSTIGFTEQYQYWYRVQP